MMLNGEDQAPADMPTIDQDADGFEWALVEIFGHRTHAGRAREEERFGSKMLRIDVPTVAWQDHEDATPTLTVTGWKTHFYGGASIFSYSLMTEEAALRANAPYRAPHRIAIAAPDHSEDLMEEF